eukprot:GHVT01053356.1.p2 GENE.GHVT01053356.1~~GHVT01053356.1.p2  ORF type:complete len:214 (+),score=18.43 GHVT01053356.1:176-817(+)
MLMDVSKHIITRANMSENQVNEGLPPTPVALPSASTIPDFIGETNSGAALAAVPPRGECFLTLMECRVEMFGPLAPLPSELPFAGLALGHSGMCRVIRRYQEHLGELPGRLISLMFDALMSPLTGRLFLLASTIKPVRAYSNNATPCARTALQQQCTLPAGRVPEVEQICRCIGFLFESTTPRSIAPPRPTDSGHTSDSAPLFGARPEGAKRR